MLAIIAGWPSGGVALKSWCFLKSRIGGTCRKEVLARL